MGILTDPELWKRIRDYEFLPMQDGGSFEAYVQAETGWSEQDTLQGINEYLRFAYLCMVAPGGCVPSPVVDEVWHIHLTVTLDYWRTFCPQALGRPLHHIPKPEKFFDDPVYKSTLARYEAEFGAPAPGKFWPAEHEKNFQRAVLSVSGIFAAALLITGQPLLLFGVVAPIVVFAMISGPSRNNRSDGGGCGGCGGD